MSTKEETVKTIPVILGKRVNYPLAAIMRWNVAYSQVKCRYFGLRQAAPDQLHGRRRPTTSSLGMKGNSGMISSLEAIHDELMSLGRAHSCESWVDAILERSPISCHYCVIGCTKEEYFRPARFSLLIQDFRPIMTMAPPNRNSFSSSFTNFSFTMDKMTLVVGSEM